MRVESIQVGVPRTYGQEDAVDPFDRPWTSAIAKEAVSGRIWAGSEGLTGDRVADTKGHGGSYRALLMYPAEHYPAWRAEWGRKDVGPGGFGENLTVSGMHEATVCLGDVFAIGEVVLEVASPRGPCSNLSRRYGRRDLVTAVRQNHRHGWYVRVCSEGWLEAGMEVRLSDRPFPQWAIIRAADVYWAKDNIEEAALLAACPALIPEWRERLSVRIGA